MNMASATTVNMAFVLKIYWQECPCPLLSSKEPYPFFHPESSLELQGRVWNPCSKRGKAEHLRVKQ